MSSAASRALAALLLAAASASCQETPATDVTIRFELDSRAGSFCADTDCESYPMRCGARLSVRLLDTEESITGRGESVRRTCEDIESSSSLCDLKNEDELKIFDVPLHHIRVEVAAWHPADLPGPDCPVVPFDLKGRPLPEFRPRPALAGAAPFDVSSDKVELMVPLQCTDIARLDDEQCQAEPMTLLKAQVDDLANGFAVSEAQAEELSVRAAQPTPVDGSTTAFRIEVDAFIDLSRVVGGGPPPTFEHNYLGQMSGDLCTVVLDSGAQVTATASCTTVSMMDDRTQLNLRGVLVTTETLQPLLDAMGSTFPEMGSAFPETGLVVGRVFDQSSTPMAGVRVIPTGGATVEYLNEAGTGFSGTTTSSQGYFISRDAPFRTEWRATHADGHVSQREQTAGLVDGMVSPVILRMIDPDAPPPGGEDDPDDDDGADLGDGVP